MVLLAAASMVVATASPSAQWVDSTYSTAAVRALVERASVQNRYVPDSLRAYVARAESELAIAARQSDGVEQTFAVEQTANVVRWHRGGTYEQRVVGYRSQSVGLTLSAVGMFRQAWLVPMLYGNRIALLLGQPDSAARGDTPRRRRARRANATMAVHPFASDRDQVYRFSGGDTIATLRPGGREIPIARIRVEPRPERVTRPTTLFRGDIELDADRAHIVRMRGYFVTVGRRRPGAVTRLVASQIEAVAYVELENGEYDQRFWLPTYQRFEAQAAVPLLGEQRAILRVVTRFRRLEVNPPDTPLFAPLDSLGSDTLRLVPHRLTFAPADSVGRYRGWARDVGELAASVRADDFTDVAPDPWRLTGPPLVRPRYENASDLFHYNRVEGAYTGIGVEARFRDAAPGLVARATLGWAWAEHTARGRVRLEQQRGSWSAFARAGRTLDITNDFREPFDSGSTLSALFSVDAYDYVDRRHAMVGVTHVMGRQAGVRLRLEAGVGSDRYAVTRRSYGPLARSDSGFRINRGVDPGRYAIATAKIEVNPEVNAAFVSPGVGAMIQADVAGGDLSWQRIEMRAVARRTAGPFLVAVRADGGMVFGQRIPPQQLFELGENQNLPGYGYKEFAGNQAAVVRGAVMLPLPLWRAPIRVRRWVLPAIAPMLSAGVQSGWARASNDAARESIARLGTVADSVMGWAGTTDGAPLSRPTDGVKSSVDVRLRFFGGALSVGTARAIDRQQRWRFVFGFAHVL
ncbi:MAG TPA: hypothetical protein VFZ21_27965 [Gemmatimonadaceae bacterium]|jgi:hypothetical protein|nr:hypothetical protein [Gemmatimonadaceae bacterium]